MMIFALELIMHANEKHNYSNFIDQRITIIHYDHATELLMKAYLEKEGYLIHEIKTSKLKKGIKENTELKELLNFDKTIGFKDALNLVSKLVKLDKKYKKKIEKLHDVRNKIQHKSTDIPLNKDEVISNFIPASKKLYSKMFPKYFDIFPAYGQRGRHEQLEELKDNIKTNDSKIQS